MNYLLQVPIPQDIWQYVQTGLNAFLGLVLVAGIVVFIIAEVNCFFKLKNANPQEAAHYHKKLVHNAFYFVGIVVICAGGGMLFINFVIQAVPESSTKPFDAIMSFHSFISNTLA